MPQSAFIVRVPEAEPFVSALRERFDPVAHLGVPAHLTLLFPFAAPERITPQMLDAARAIAGATREFPFRLARLERFPSTLYLAPEPAQPFVALTEQLARAFPEFPPYGGAFDTIVPHLTVAHGSRAELDAVERELRGRWPREGVAIPTCAPISLIEDSTGRWRTMREFSLGRPVEDA